MKHILTMHGIDNTIVLKHTELVNSIVSNIDPL